MVYSLRHVQLPPISLTPPLPLSGSASPNAWVNEVGDFIYLRYDIVSLTSFSFFYKFPRIKSQRSIRYEKYVEFDQGHKM